MQKKKFNTERTIYIQFVSALDGHLLYPPLNLPLAATHLHLNRTLNDLVKNEEDLNYSFSIRGTPLLASSLEEHLNSNALSVESVLEIVYSKQTVVSSKHITRCSTTISGHSESVLVVAFSPNGLGLCSGSGDTTIRFWDTLASKPARVGKNFHRSWVLSISWSPDSVFVASGGLDGLIGIWMNTSKELKGTLKGHTSWVSCLSWAPCHLVYPCRNLLSGGKDGSIRIWDVLMQRCRLKIIAHTQTVNCVRWGGNGRLYSGSADGTIKVWSSENGQLMAVLNSHRHWVNTIALSSDHVLRTGIFDMTEQCTVYAETSDHQKKALRRYEKVTECQSERIVSGSDDFTLSLWTTANYQTPKARMTGHRQSINYVCFSPDGKWLASASFDNSIRLWNGRSGQLLSDFRAHTGPVYMCAWSPDSQLLISASKDSTLKLWDICGNNLKESLLGHTDEVFAVDWSPAGTIMASAGKDKVIKLWKL